MKIGIIGYGVVGKAAFLSNTFEKVFQVVKYELLKKSRRF